VIFVEWLIWVGVAAVLVVLVAVLARSRSARPGRDEAEAAPSGADRLRPAVAEFHVADGAARVHFDVPLGDDDDPVLAELLGREAVEVVREKRHQLPIGDVTAVVALGRRGDEWVAVSTIRLETPGTLPPPMVPEIFAHGQRTDDDLFERFADLPTQAPGVADRVKGEELAPMASELRLPGSVSAGLRSQGIDPDGASAGDIVLGVMRVAGYQLSEVAPGTFTGARGGQRTFVRVVDHAAGSHPELDEQEVRQFVVDFGSSGAERGLLITEKYSPFEVYERERRDKRVRFITRERIQSFVDALSVG
jgi:hypothetical protein